MDESRFWRLVDAAKAQAGDNELARPPALHAALADLAPAEIQGFQRVYEEMLTRANRWDLIGAAYLMNIGGCSDDGFRYFRDWLISEGQAVFEAALAAPDTLADFPARDFFELESFGYAAMHAYAEHSDEELDRDFSIECAEPEGAEWGSEQLPALLPRLSAKYAR